MCVGVVNCVVSGFGVSHGVYTVSEFVGCLSGVRRSCFGAVVGVCVACSSGCGRSQVLFVGFGSFAVGSL